ncbi:MAG: hypothetical protein ACMUFK_03875 [Thermoplasmatota archaeon]
MKLDDPETNRSISQEIGEVHAAEKGSISLTALPDNFYEKANSFMDNTRTRIENFKASTREELSEEYYRLAREYKRSKDILNDIYNSRERKIALMAMNSARKISYSTDNMTLDEQNLFFDLKMEMEKARGRVLRFWARSQEPLRGETGMNIPLVDYEESEPEPLSLFREKKVSSPPPPNLSVKIETEKERSKEPQTSKPSGGTGSDIPADMVLVKALKDIATFMCPDNTSITMKKEDVAVLPREIVDILLLNGSVEAIGGTR